MLNQDDLRQIQAIATAGNTALEARIAARQGAAVETIAAEISASRAELAAKIDNMERRFETIVPSILGAETRLIVLTRGVDQILALHGKITGDQAATQRAFDQLAARVTKIEREMHPGQ